MTQEIHGTVADGFEAVREEFTAFVAGERADYEGQLCAYVHGRKVVDLWAGTGADALFGVFSSTKGAAYLVVLGVFPALLISVQRPAVDAVLALIGGS